MMNDNPFMQEKRVKIEEAIDHIKNSLMFFESKGLDRKALQALVKWIREQQEKNKRQEEWEAMEREAENDRIGIRAYYRD